MQIERNKSEFFSYEVTTGSRGWRIMTTERIAILLLVMMFEYKTCFGSSCIKNLTVHSEMVSYAMKCFRLSCLVETTERIWAEKLVEIMTSPSNHSNQDWNDFLKIKIIENSVRICLHEYGTCDIISTVELKCRTIVVKNSPILLLLL